MEIRLCLLLFVVFGFLLAIFKLDNNVYSIVHVKILSLSVRLIVLVREDMFNHLFPKVMLSLNPLDHRTMATRTFASMLII